MWKQGLSFKQSGFTLIELLIVIVIIAALAVAVFIALNPVKRLQDARNARRTTDIESIRTAINEYLSDKATLPPGLTVGMQETQIGTSNGSGVGANNPSCINITGSCNATSQSCVDLSTPLVTYLKNIPQDPKIGSAAATGYSVSVDANNIITVNACGSESVSNNLLSRNDLIYGTEIGAWRPNGNPTINTTTNIPTLTKAAKITTVRFAEADCFQGLTCGTDNHVGTATKANFDSVINGIINNLSAQPIIKFEPIANNSAVINGINQSVFCPPVNNLSMNLPMYESIVGYAGNRVHLYESTNEGEYDCYSAWGYPSAGSVGVSQVLGNHFAQNMPAVKKYARSLGIDIKTIGYIGVAGGVGWGQTCTTPRLRSIDEFNNAAHQAYVTAGNDPDYIPDAESIHTYPYPSDFPETSSYTCVYQYYKLFAQAWRQELVNIWGPTIGNQIKLADSEWEAGQLGWTQWSNASAVQSFYTGWISYVFQGNALPDASVGTTERWWAANLFNDATDNNYYDFIKADGTTYPWYDTFKNLSLTDPNR